MMRVESSEDLKMNTKKEQLYRFLEEQDVGPQSVWYLVYQRWDKTFMAPASAVPFGVEVAGTIRFVVWQATDQLTGRSVASVELGDMVIPAGPNTSRRMVAVRCEGETPSDEEGWRGAVAGMCAAVLDDMSEPSATQIHLFAQTEEAPAIVKIWDEVNVVRELRAGTIDSVSQEVITKQVKQLLCLAELVQQRGDDRTVGEIVLDMLNKQEDVK